MRKKLFAALGAACAVLLSTGPAHSESNRVTFPEDLEKLVHYMTVRRGNTTEHLSTTQAAIDAVKKGQPIPNGTKFVLTDFRDDKLFRYFVMEKGAGWGADYKNRTGDWQFQWFWPNKQINTAENTSRCMGCHTPQRANEFLFTARRITEYSGKPIE